MNSLNLSQIIGNITAEIETKNINGRSVANFSVATNRQWLDEQGNEIKQTEFHSITLWGKLADNAPKFLKKGDKVYVQGRLHTRSWEGEDGTKRYKTDIVAERVIAMSKKKSDENTEQDQGPHIDELAHDPAWNKQPQ